MNLNFKEDDFESFDPIAYLDEYFNYDSDNYGGVGVENEYFLRFFADVENQYELQGAKLLDFGCGPTIYSVISLGKDCESIHLSDYLSQNLEQVKVWQADADNAFNWGPYIKRSLQLEKTIENGLDADTALIIPQTEVDKRESSLRTKITKIVQGNARSENPVGDEGKSAYDAVVSSFCLEGVADDLAEWEQLLENLTSTLKPGGLLVFATQIEADSYRIGDAFGKVVNITENDLRSNLISCGFKEDTINIVEVEGAPDHHEYEKFSMLTAVRS